MFLLVRSEARALLVQTALLSKARIRLTLKIGLSLMDKLLVTEQLMMIGVCSQSEVHVKEAQINRIVIGSWKLD